MFEGRGKFALRFAATAVVSLAVAGSASCQTLVEIQSDMPGVKFVPVLSVAQRVKALSRLVKTASPIQSAIPVSLTPNAPYAADGSHLSFWKPSFVIGTANGGEAGINYWGKYQEGHMNVAFSAGRAMQTLLDCRILTAGHLMYKVYDRDELQTQGEITLIEGHAFLILPGTGETLSVELWPVPQTQPLGILGCELSPIREDKS